MRIIFRMQAIYDVPILVYDHGREKACVFVVDKGMSIEEIESQFASEWVLIVSR